MDLNVEISRKRRKVDLDRVVDSELHSAEGGSADSATHVLDSLKRSISPPTIRRPQSVQASLEKKQYCSIALPSSSPSSSYSEKPVTSPVIKTIPSPVQLSTVSELPSSSNVDTVSLKDVLGDPLIKECWLFNYLFDVDFIM